MAVIKEIKNGSGGVIRIHDDYCKNNTPEDKDAVKPECFLGIYKRRLRDLKTLQGNPDYLKVWQMEKRMGLHVTVQESIFLAESQVRQNDLKEILKYTTVAKFMHRIEQYSGCEIPDTMQEPMCGRAAGAVNTGPQHGTG